MERQNCNEPKKFQAKQGKKSQKKVGRGPIEIRIYEDKHAADSPVFLQIMCEGQEIGRMLMR